MHLSATHINYLILCPRKLWLFSNGINMEHTSDTVYDGKLLHETSYPQRNEKHREMEILGSYNDIELSGKIDFYDANSNTVHETKRSDKVEEAHEWQVKFYIWLLQMNDIPNATAILEYPKLRKKEVIELSERDTIFLQNTILEIEKVLKNPKCPEKIHSKICKSCSYYELCYIDE